MNSSDRPAIAALRQRCKDALAHHDASLRAREVLEKRKWWSRSRWHRLGYDIKDTAAQPVVQFFWTPRPYFGQPIAAQGKWIKEHRGRKVPERSAEDVYWEYVEKVGEEACADAVLNYLDYSAVVEILLERIDADDSDEFLHDNLIADFNVVSGSRNQD
jgi:hypothetical protein